MNTKFVICLCIALSVILFGAVASAQMDCTMCHGDLTSKKVVHAAAHMGCETCHSAIDASDIPHKKNNKIPKGLSSSEPDLCYACHDKSKFSQKNVHAAVAMGCSNCHNPHSTDNEKLLKLLLPDICYNCHDKAGFNKLNIHMPVAGGMCMSCHNPHSSDNLILLNKALNGVCVDCHADVIKKPHAIQRGHLLGGDGKLNDPVRKGKKFYCGSCHDPHSSNSIKLFRYEVEAPIKICAKCHAPEGR